MERNPVDARCQPTLASAELGAVLYNSWSICRQGRPTLDQPALGAPASVDFLPAQMLGVCCPGGEFL